MKSIFLLIAIVAGLAQARTPIDTLAVQRTDSGNVYVKIHAAYPREQLVYGRFTPDALPSGVATQLIDSAKGVGSVYAPIATAPTRYMLNMTAFASATTNWSYVLKVDTTTVLSATATGTKIQIRNLEIYADTLHNKLYMRRTVFADASTATVIDSAVFTRWHVPSRISWTINPTNPATLLGVSGSIEQ